MFFAEIKLHPGASSSNDEHSNFIGGKREIVGPLLLCSLSLLFLFLFFLLAGLEEAARNEAGSRQGTWLVLLLLLLLASQRSTA